MNERSEIVGWVSHGRPVPTTDAQLHTYIALCHGQSNAEISELLDGLKT
jgi:hypothetical protein